jgi:hypothetical protein
MAIRPLTAALIAAGVGVGTLAGALSNPSTNLAAVPSPGVSIAMAPQPAAPAPAASVVAPAPPPVEDVPATPAPDDDAAVAPAEDTETATATETETDGDAVSTETPASGKDETTTDDDTSTTEDDDSTATQDPEPVKLPAVGHVWLVMLPEQSYNSLFGTGSGATYLNGTLRTQGVLLSRFHGVSHGGLTGAIATISGQGPTPELQAGCGTYADVAPGAVDTATGQAKGAGCVFGAKVSTLASQLKANNLTWRAYIAGQGAPGDAAASCRHPVLGAADPTAASAPDGYRTTRNPFMYFHGIVDDPACATDDVGLDQLGADLDAASIPTVSYIAPPVSGPENAVADSDAWLQQWIPRIRATDAYKKDGLVVILPEAGAAEDTTGCCDALDLPNVEDDKKGGGRSGALLLSPFADHGRADTTPADHFSVLRTIEDLFNLPYLGFAKQREPLATALSSGDQTTTTG